MKYLLFYDYIEGVVERRAPLREGHLGFAQRYFERGALLLAGARPAAKTAALGQRTDRQAPAVAAARSSTSRRPSMRTRIHRPRSCWNAT